MQKTINKLTKMVQQDNRLLALFLFGSRAREDDYKGSDMDICLIMKPDSYTSIKLSQKRLEYATLFDMDIQVFQQLPIYIKMRIIKEGRLLYCRNEDELYQIIFCMIREFGDFEHIYRDYLKEVAHAG